jgi:nitrite reductase (NADH) small subunit
MSTVPAPQRQTEWRDICGIDDLVENSGICARIHGKQVALFLVPDAEPPVYALDNWCPAAQANVLSRGIVGDMNGELVVASPLYKEHFLLRTGACMEKPLSVSTWPVRLSGERILIQAPLPV